MRIVRTTRERRGIGAVDTPDRRHGQEYETLLPSESARPIEGAALQVGTWIATIVERLLREPSATDRKSSPSRRKRIPLSAPQSRAAISTSVSNTGCRSNGRAADDLEHVRGRGLLLQRFAQLVQQPRVLDGDHRLGGEVLDQLDLLVGERPDLLAEDVENIPISFLILEHRHDHELCVTPTEFDGGHRHRIALDVDGLRHQVGDMRHLLGLRSPGPRASRIGQVERHHRWWRASTRCRRRIVPRGRDAKARRLGRGNRLPKLAPQMRVAFSSIAWNTGCNSPGELEMTRSTSAVAVCWSSDLRSSLSKRVFSIAITA